MLAEASGQIKQAISDLYDGAAALQANLGYAQYKALMAQNGLDIDALLAGNAQAVETIRQYEALLEQISGIPRVRGAGGAVQVRSAGHRRAGDWVAQRQQRRHRRDGELSGRGLPPNCRP